MQLATEEFLGQVAVSLQQVLETKQEYEQTIKRKEFQSCGLHSDRYNDWTVTSIDLQYDTLYVL